MLGDLVRQSRSGGKRKVGELYSRVRFLGVRTKAFMVHKHDRPRKKHETSSNHATPKCTHEREISAAVERWEKKYRAPREGDRLLGNDCAQDDVAR